MKLLLSEVLIQNPFDATLAPLSIFGYLRSKSMTSESTDFTKKNLGWTPEPVSPNDLPDYQGYTIILFT